jgi:hypothetical protein
LRSKLTTSAGDPSTTQSGGRTRSITASGTGRWLSGTGDRRVGIAEPPAEDSNPALILEERAGRIKGAADAAIVRFRASRLSKTAGEMFVAEN